MTQRQFSWRRFIRPTRGRVAMFIALSALLCLYQMYFTPQKRIVRQRLSETDAKSEKAINAHLKPLTKLFARGRKGAKDFAQEALSLRGKWEMLKGFVQGSQHHQAYLSDLFESNIFSADELRAAMESSVKAYLDDVEGFESELLVQLRADLADPDRMNQPLPEGLRGTEAFREEYRKLTRQVMAELHTDLGVSAGREVGLFIATDIATCAALEASKAAAAELGINAGILGTGAASTVATLGVGMVIAIIIDYVVDEVFRLAGYDPAAKIESLICESINKLEAALIRDAGTFSFHKKGALRQRMEELHELRSRLRREAITRLLSEGGIK